MQKNDPAPISASSPSRSPIFLIGYRCTGKSTVARLLAEQLAWRWIDADELLESRQGKTIRQIFAEVGESGFRDKEEALLAELCHSRDHVIATGGGIILREGNRERLKQAGWIVWLTADARTLWERMQADRTTAERRPALTVGGLAEVEELLRAREPWYRACADAVVDTVGKPPEAVVADIQALLANAKAEVD